MTFSPMTDPAAFDRLVLIYSGRRAVLPGVPNIKVTREPREDAVQTAGTSGETVSDFGDSTATVAIDFMFSSAEQYREFVGLLKVLRIKTGEKPRVYDAVHPSLQAHGIRKLRLLKIQDNGYTPMGGYKAQLDFAEFYQPKSGSVVQVPPATEAQTNAATGVPTSAPLVGTGASKLMQLNTRPASRTLGQKGKQCWQGLRRQR